MQLSQNKFILTAAAMVYSICSNCIFPTGFVVLCVYKWRILNTLEFSLMLILPRLTSMQQMPSIFLALGWGCNVYELKTTERISGVFLQEFLFGVIAIK